MPKPPTLRSSSRAALLRVFAVAGSLLVAIALVMILPLGRPQAVQASPDQKALGATLFHEKGCEHCHGADGRGGELGPDLSTIGKRWKKPQIATQIHDGGGGMPAFADVLQPDEVTALVEYLHTKKKAPKQKKGVPAPKPAAPVPSPDSLL